MKSGWTRVMLASILSVGVAAVSPISAAFAHTPTHPLSEHLQKHEPMLVTAVPAQALKVKDIQAFRKLFLQQVQSLSKRTQAHADVSERHTFYCSSFVQQFYKSCGIWIPSHSVDGQSKYGVKVNSISELKVGDLVFVKSHQQLSHVYLYAGDGYVLHPHKDQIQRISVVNSAFKEQFLFAKRIIE